MDAYTPETSDAIPRRRAGRRATRCRLDRPAGGSRGPVAGLGPSHAAGVRPARTERTTPVRSTCQPGGDCTDTELSGELERPAGTAQLFLGAGVAGIYQVTCLPEARRQGIGGAVTWAALRAARARSYRVGILPASEQGSGVHRRLGYQAYGRLNQYGWAN